MVTILLTPQNRVYPHHKGHTFTYVKKIWSDDWVIIDDMTCKGGGVASGGTGMGSCEIEHRYSKKKKQWNSAYAVDKPVNYSGYWVRIVLTGDQNTGTDLFIGRIPAEKQRLFGSSIAKTGRQMYTAYAPLQELRKERVSKSYVIDQAERKIIGWIPVFNQRDEHNMLTGNRTAKKQDGTYYFGGSDEWTRLQILEYFVKNFIDKSESDEEGPVWNIAGQTEYLDQMIDTIRIRQGMDLEKIVSKIIDKKLGFDYKVVTNYTKQLEDSAEETGGDDIAGFTIHIFSTSPQKFTYGDYTLPKNPNIIRMDFETKEVFNKQIEKSTTLKHNSLKVTGARMIVCLSLWGPHDINGDARTNYQIEGKWTDAKGSSYQAPGGADGAADDELRREPGYAEVYQSFGALSNWGYAGPVLDTQGKVIGIGASYQTQFRETLIRLPLRYGYDYTSNPAANENPDNYVADFVKPMAYIYNADKDKYFEAKNVKIGANITALKNEWGLRLNTHDNHVFAKNVWPVGAHTSIAPRFDWRKMVMTIALKTDHRLTVHVELDPEGEGDIELRVPNAQLWYLASDTVVGVKNGVLQQTSIEGRVLRNDADKLGPIVCAAQARYHLSQIKGQYSVQGWQPWADQIGGMFTPELDENKIPDWMAPISSVKWERDGSTKVTLGYG